MTAQDLVDFLTAEIPNFREVRLHGAGTAYHYTPHGDAIRRLGRFLGAAITPDLDRTQSTLQSPPATDDPGVVFAYEQLDDAREEGFGCEVFEIDFSAAVSALHGQEADLSALLVDVAPPRTFLILTSDIQAFRPV